MSATPQDSPPSPATPGTPVNVTIPKLGHLATDNGYDSPDTTDYSQSIKTLRNPMSRAASQLSSIETTSSLDGAPTNDSASETAIDASTTSIKKDARKSSHRPRFRDVSVFRIAPPCWNMPLTATCCSSNCAPYPLSLTWNRAKVQHFLASTHCKSRLAIN